MSGRDLKTWARQELRGVENILMPSFDAELRELDEDGVRWDVRQAIAHGFSSTICATEAGLSPDEAKRFVEVAVEEAAGRINVGLSMPLDSWALARDVLDHAEQAGASHALVGFPQSFHPAGEDDVHDALAALMDGSGLGYVLPVTDRAPMPVPGGIPFGAYHRLADLPNVVGMRLAVPLPPIVFRAFAQFGQRLVVGIGTPDLIGGLILLRRGFGAQWLAAAHWELWQSPDRRYVVDFCEAVLDGRERDALDTHWRAGAARAIAYGTGIVHPEYEDLDHWPLAKYVSWSVGGNGGLTRDPAMRIMPHELEARRAMLGALGIQAPGEFGEFVAGRAHAAAA